MFFQTMQNNNSNQEIIDFRSDASTQPTYEMREAMTKADLGDDVYEDDPTTIELEKYAAELMGKEAALLVPSGCFGNQVSILTHSKRGDEMIVADKSHIIQWEIAASVYISGVTTRTITANKKTGLMDINEVERNIRKGYDVHFPTSKLLCVENPTCNGYVASLDYMKQMYDLAKKYKLNVHFDGARIFNAAHYLNVDVKEIAKYCDSVQFCLSKGLCSPMGSIICGTKEFIFNARYNRKLMGGGMRQTGVMAAPGLISLKKHAPLLGEDRQMAILFAEKANKQLIDYIEPIDTNSIHINMVWFITKEGLQFNPQDMVNHLKEKANILMLPEFGPRLYRIVTHYYIREKEINQLVFYLKQFFDNLK